VLTLRSGCAQLSLAKPVIGLMSYRSFKRVLGETSLERKCRFLFGACLLVLITGSFWWYGNRTEQLVYDQSRETGKNLVELTLNNKHWVSLEGNKDFQRVAEQIARKFRTQNYEASWLYPTPEDRPPDGFDREVLDYYEKTPANQAVSFRDTRSNARGQFKYDYYQPVYAEKFCLTCHQRVGPPRDASLAAAVAGRAPAPISLGENDLMAVVHISLDDDTARRALNLNRAVLLATAIVTVFLAMLAAYVIVRYVIVKPLKHLREVSDAISQGDTETRADIHTADEFEELGLAFNHMLRTIMSSQQELQLANISLDGKVDELAQMNMRLYEMNRLRSDFLATMSHELRTPLNSIIGFSDVLGSIDSLNDKQKRYVQNIQKSGRMLLDMINDILDLAKIESGKMELRLSDFRIDQVISAQCDLARPLAERKNVDLDTEIEPGLPPLHQDQGKVQQILNNLLSNAIKFTPDGGRIEVRAEQDNQGDLLLFVTDTGIGIALDDQVSIFEKFRQGRTSLPSGDAMTREYSGTGLGLSIVKELCRLLGGEVTVASELGKGSVFTVRLPWLCPRHARGEQPHSDGLDEVSRALQLDFARPALPSPAQTR
jgi:signal transduction histidine kinase